MTLEIAILIGAVCGLAATIGLSRNRGLGLAVSHGIVVGCLPLTGASVIRSNQIEGMGAIPYAVLAGALIQFVIVPCLCLIVILEVRRIRRKRARVRYPPDR